MASPSISLGIDLGGRRIAWSVASETDLIGVAHFESKINKNRALEVAACTDALMTAITGMAITEVFIEEPYIGKGTRSSLQLAQMCGAVLQVLGAHTTLNPQLVPVSTWKLQVCGKGNLDKDGVTAWLDHNHPEWLDDCRFRSPRGLERVNQDRVDAICIGQMGNSQRRHGLGSTAA